MIEEGTTFMTQGQEFRVVYKNEEKNRIAVQPIDKITWMPRINLLLLIENVYYKTIYIHSGKNRITLELVRKGD